MRLRAEVGPGFDAVADAFATVTAGGLPAAFVLHRAGERVVGLSSGVDATGRPFTIGTPVFLFSVVKPFAALTVLLAVADGWVDLDRPVAADWPAFGAHGKDAVTVRTLLAHGAAVPGWREPVRIADLRDRPAAAAALAASPPWWPPGEPGEHAVSYGHLVDAVLRACTGRDVIAWWERVRAATGADLRLRPGEGPVAPAPLEDPRGRWRRARRRASGPMGGLLRNPPGLIDAAVLNGPQVRALVAPAVTGYASAEALAAAWQWWNGAGGTGALGRRLRDEALRPQLTGHDHVLGRRVAWGLGPQIDEDFIGLGGAGGCVAGHDPLRGLSMAFTTPRLGSFDRLDPLEAALSALT